MTSGGAGAWRSRGSREAMPKPVSRTSPAASTRTFAGLMSLWMRPCRWTWRSAAASAMASAGSASGPAAGRECDRADRRRDPRAPASCGLRGASSPMGRSAQADRARSRAHIRARGAGDLRASAERARAQAPGSGPCRQTADPGRECTRYLPVAFRARSRKAPSPAASDRPRCDGPAYPHRREASRRDRRTRRRMVATHQPRGSRVSASPISEPPVAVGGVVGRWLKWSPLAQLCLPRGNPNTGPCAAYGKPRGISGRRPQRVTITWPRPACPAELPRLSIS